MLQRDFSFLSLWRPCRIYQPKTKYQRLFLFPFLQKGQLHRRRGGDFHPFPICKIGGISSINRIKGCTVVLPIPKPCSTISSVCNFVPSWDEVKSVRKLCRFITSSFILQEKAHSDDRILLSILSVLAGAVFPDGMTAMTGMTGILGYPFRCHPLRENTL